MDVSMPVMNGKDATRPIREYEAQRGVERTPIIGVTAHALFTEESSCLEMGMDDYLPKPISPKVLLTKVREWMQDQDGVVVSVS